MTLFKITAEWCKNCNILSDSLKPYNINFININIDYIDDIKNDFINSYNEDLYNIIDKVDKLPTIIITNDKYEYLDRFSGYNNNRFNELLDFLKKYNVITNLDYNEEF